MADNLHFWRENPLLRVFPYVSNAQEALELHNYVILKFSIP